MRFKIDWASLTFGSKFTVFALYYFVFEGNFRGKSPGGAYIWRGDLTEGFLRYEFGGLICGGAYTWRGLFLEFYGMSVDRLQVNPGRFPSSPKFRKVRLEIKRKGQMERSYQSDRNVLFVVPSIVYCLQEQYGGNW